jgi:cohesin loading factor
VNSCARYERGLNFILRYGNAPWLYALRFLRASLSFRSEAHHEIVLAIQHLRAICSFAERNDDKAIYVASLTLEALAHMRSESFDSLMNAQEAVAKARSLQMHPATNTIPQVWAMLNCVDLVCSLSQFNAKEAAGKMSTVQQTMDELIVEKASWSSDGSIPIPLGKKSAQKVTDFAAQIYIPDDSGVSLPISWLSNVDAYAVAYLLCGSTILLKAPTDKKAETFIQEGIKVVDGE